MFLGSNLNTSLSGTFGKLFVSLNSEASAGVAGNERLRDVSTSIDPWILDGKLKFHPIHGKEIMLSEDNTGAKRSDHSFEYSVIFSHRPVGVNEVVAIEITKLSRDFCGPLKIGFTAVDPVSFGSQFNVPFGRDLKNVPGVWLKALLLDPMEVGSVIYYTVNNDGRVFYGINGEQSGVFLTGVDTSVPLWVVLEPYGAVQGVKFVEKEMIFTYNRRTMLDFENAGIPSQQPLEDVRNLPLPFNNGTTVPRVESESERSQYCCGNFLSLFARRNVTVDPLQNLDYHGLHAPSASTNTPMTPAYRTPVTREFFGQGLCIICTEREKNTAFIKCGHLCMCHQCAQKFIKVRRSTSQQGRRERNSNNALCPMCREPIASLFRIYT